MDGVFQHGTPVLVLFSCSVTIPLINKGRIYLVTGTDGADDRVSSLLNLYSLDVRSTGLRYNHKL